MAQPRKASTDAPRQANATSPPLIYRELGLRSENKSNPSPLTPSIPVSYTDVEQPKGKEQLSKGVITTGAKGEVARRRPSHQPGYPRKDRQGKVGLMIQLTLEQREQLHAAAQEGGYKSTQEFVTLVLAEVAKQYLSGTPQKPTLSEVVPEALETQRVERAAIRAAVLRLAETLR